MPVYEYKCQDCEHEFSIFFTSFDTGVVQCPLCQSKNVKKLISCLGNVTRKLESSGSSCGSCSSGNCSSCRGESC